MDFLIFVLILIVLRNFWENLSEDYLRPILHSAHGRAGAAGGTTPARYSVHQRDRLDAAIDQLGWEILKRVASDEIWQEIAIKYFDVKSVILAQLGRESEQ